MENRGNDESKRNQVGNREITVGMMGMWGIRMGERGTGVGIRRNMVRIIVQ